MKKQKGVIFDLDGTLLDTLKDITCAVNYGRSLGDFPPIGEEEVRSFLGDGVRELIRRSIPYGERNPLFEDALKQFKEYYKEYNDRYTKPYEGIEELLNGLKEEGYHLAVVSNKMDVVAKQLTQKYFSPWIDVIVGEQEGLKKKPDGEMVEYCLEQMKLTKEQVIYVGDSEVDFWTAENTGIPSIIVSWGFRDKDWLEKNKMKCIVDTVEQLKEQIDRENQYRGHTVGDKNGKM